MIGAYRIEAYVIVSADGKLADASGVQPASLHFEADQRNFEKGLDHAAVVVNGRHSQEGHANAMSRRRLVLTRQIASLALDSVNPNARLWNPAGASLEDACDALGVSSGTVAVIGGPQVFTLFLKLGYDCFHLSRAVKVCLPGGHSVFSPERISGEPDATLSAAGLKAQPPLRLDDGLTLTDWVRTAD
jgi:hypothetical protein